MRRVLFSRYTFETSIDFEPAVTNPINETSRDFVVSYLPLLHLLWHISLSFHLTPETDLSIMHNFLVGSCLCFYIQANTYTKLFLELGIVIGTQILDMLQECLLVDRPDRREEEHLEGEKNVANNVTICYFLRAYFSFSIC